MKLQVGGIDGELHVGEPLRECGVRRSQFHPRQLRPHAAMQPMPERQVSGGLGRGTQRFAGRRPGIAGGGWEMGQHDRALLDQVPANSDVLLGEAREGDLDDGQLPQQFLNDGIDRVGILRQRLPQLRVLQQHHSAQSEHRGGGLHAAVECPIGQPAEIEVVDVRPRCRE